jgi:lipoprotein-releasing system permease protein
MLVLKIALRFLKSSGLQTVLIVFGISTAVAFQVFVGLLIDGLQRNLIASTVGNSPHITVSSSKDVATIGNWDSLAGTIRGTAGVSAVASSATSNAFARKGSKMQPVVMRGFDFDQADRIYGIAGKMVEGTPYVSRGEIIAGVGLRNDFGLKVGDSLSISNPSNETVSLRVTGFYKLGVGVIDNSWILTRRETAQAIFSFGDRITQIEIRLSDPFMAVKVSDDIRQILDNPNLKIDNWEESNQQLLGGLEGQRASSSIIQIVIVASVVVAIGSVLAISVLQKSRQIGILKAMGITDRSASLIFLVQGILVGSVGSAVGAAMGAGMVYLFSSFVRNPDGSALVEYYLDYGFIIRSWATGTAASTLAGVIPALKSMRLSPVDVIKAG